MGWGEGRVRLTYDHLYILVLLLALRVKLRRRVIVLFAFFAGGEEVDQEWVWCGGAFARGWRGWMFGRRRDDLEMFGAKVWDELSQLRWLGFLPQLLRRLDISIIRDLS